VWTSWFHQLRRGHRAAQEQAEAAIRLSTEHGFSLWIAMANMIRGWALVMQGQCSEGMAQLQQGLTKAHAMGADVQLAHHLALFAESHWRVGQREAGLSMLADALNHLSKSGARFYEAELYRLKGILTIQCPVSGREQPGSSAVAEAGACFHQAIQIARSRGAKSLELRATTCLARLWQQQGLKEEARNILAETYNWFTEGLDTADLQEAKQLLNELDQEL
jgi:predicted ATPase